MASLLNQILGIQQPGDPVDDQGLTQANRTQGGWGGIAQLGATLAAIGQPGTGAEHAAAMAGFGKVPSAIAGINKENTDARSTQAATIHTGQQTENEKTINLLNQSKVNSQREALSKIDAMDIPEYQKIRIKTAIANGQGLPDRAKSLGGGLFQDELTGTVQDIYGNKVAMGGGGGGGTPGGLADPNETPEQTLQRMQAGGAGQPGAGATPVPGATPQAPGSQLPPGFTSPNANQGGGGFNDAALAGQPNADVIKGVVQGKLPLTALGSPRNQAQYQHNLQLATAYAGQAGFDAQKYTQRAQAFKDFDVGGKYGSVIADNSRFLGHGARAGTLAEDLPTLSTSILPGKAQDLVNSGIMWWHGNNDPKIQEYLAQAIPLASEAAKASGSPDTEATTQRYLQQLDPRNGTAAIKATIAVWTKAANDRILAQQNQYKNATGFGMTSDHLATLGNPEAEKARNTIQGWSAPKSATPTTLTPAEAKAILKQRGVQGY